MPYCHLIRLIDETRAQWLALDRGGRVLGGPSEGLPGTTAEQVVVLVPSSAVLLLAAPRVARQRHQLEQAIGFAIEDHLVVPVEQVQVAVMAEPDADTVVVAAVDRSVLAGWLQRLDAHGIAPDRLMPEACLLPAQPTLLLDGATASLRYAEAGMLAGTCEEAGQWHKLLLEQGEQRPWSVLVAGQNEQVPPWTAGMDVRRIQLPTYLAERLTQLPASGYNLLTGDFAPRRQRLAGLGLWRVAAVLAIFGVLVGMTGMALERWQLDRVHAQQRAQMEALLRETVPGIERVVDARAQMLGEYNRRRGNGGGAGILAMLGRMAPLLAGSGRYTAEALDYRGGTLDLTLNTTDIATLDELRERIESLGYAVELNAMVPGPAGVEGKLRVRERRP